MTVHTNLVRLSRARFPVSCHTHTGPSIHHKRTAGAHTWINHLSAVCNPFLGASTLNSAIQKWRFVLSEDLLLIVRGHEQFHVFLQCEQCRDVVVSHKWMWLVPMNACAGNFTECLSYIGRQWRRFSSGITSTRFEGGMLSRRISWKCIFHYILCEYVSKVAGCPMLCHVIILH